MPRPSKFTPEQIEKMHQLRRDGWGAKKIGKLFNCHHTTVLWHTGYLKKHADKKSPKFYCEWCYAPVKDILLKEARKCDRCLELWHKSLPTGYAC